MPPEPLPLNEYLAALYEINGALTVTQSVVAANADAQDLVDAVLDQVQALRALDPPPEAQALHDAQDTMLFDLAAATQRFARATTEGGPGLPRALEEFITETAELGAASLALGEMQTNLALTVLDTTADPTAAYLAAVVSLQLESQVLFQDLFEIIGSTATDPDASLARLAGLTDSIELQQSAWAELDPSAEVTALHDRQIAVGSDLVDLLIELGKVVDEGVDVGFSLITELQRIAAVGPALAADWAFFFADVLGGNIRSLSGTHVTITGAGDNSEDATSIQQALVPFATETGTRILYTGVPDLPATLEAMEGTGATSDVVIFDDPRELTSRAGRRVLAPPAPVAERAEEAWPAGWMDIATVGGTRYGVPTASLLKSLVWYQPAAFAAAGYDIPETWDELSELTSRMIAEGNVPWCLGIESGVATGWIFSDWVEDILLRTQPVSVYDAWTEHEIPFDDPRIEMAWNDVLDIWATDGAVFTAGRSISESPVDASDGLLAGRCMMFRQASFLIPGLNDDALRGADALDVFLLPGMTTADRPAVVLGTFAGAFRDAHEVWAVVEYLGSDTYADERQRALSSLRGRPTGFQSANLHQNLQGYALISRSVVELLQSATVSRYDGSNLMPDEIGRFGFWTGGARVVAGGASVADILAEIEASWLAIEARFFDVEANLDACIEGDDVACDLVFLFTLDNSQAAQIGFDCAGRKNNPDAACSGFEGDPDNGDPGDDPLLDALLDLCRNGNLEGCDLLYNLSPEFSEYERLAEEQPFGP